MSDATRSATKLKSLDLAPGYRRVAEAIEDQIVSGDLTPGDLLPTETELAEILGVNRSTVREGIRSLENAGLVRRGGGKRLHVSVPETPAVSSVVSRALGLKQVSFAELWEMQMLLEPFSARLAALRRHEDVKQLIGENVLKLADCLDDDQAVILNDIEFHRLLAVATGNEALALSTAPIGALLFAATQELYALVPQARQRLLGAHQRIAAAVVAGDERQAESWMEKHIRDFRRGYELAEISIDAPITLDPRALRAD